MKLNKPQEGVSPNKDAKPGVRRPYTPPRILSAEPLEAAAALCNFTDGIGPGKAFPPCNPQNLGS